MSNKNKNICPYCGQEKILRQENFFGHIIEAYIPTCSCQKDKEKEEKKEKTKNKTQEQIKKVMEKGNIGKRYYSASFKNFQKIPQNESMYNACVKFTESFKDNSNNGTGLYLYGGVGCGKTHLAVSILKRVMGLNKKVLIYKASSLYDEYRQTYSFSNEENGDQFLKRLRKADLLIIDDLGTDKFDDKFSLFLYKIIDTRYNDMSPLVITSNFNLSQLSTVLDSRITDRLQAMCEEWSNTSASYRAIGK